MTIRHKIKPNHPASLASEDDRLWFNDHPDRFLRLRHATDGDVPHGSRGNLRVIVFCPTDGARFRFVAKFKHGNRFLADADFSDADLVKLAMEYLMETPQWVYIGDAFSDCLEKGGRLDHWMLPKRPVTPPGMMRIPGTRKH